MSLLANVLRGRLWKSRSLPKNFLVNGKPKIPNGGISITSQAPAFAEGAEVNPTMLSLVPMVANITYRDFVKQNPHLRFCDASVLDAIVQIGVDKDMGTEDLVSWCLGNIRGQVFFLGTFFESGMNEAVAFLNWKTEAPAFRYLCPADNPIRYDIPVYACVVT